MNRLVLAGLLAWTSLAGSPLALGDEPPAELADLPLDVLPPARTGDGRIAILLTGDGGWAGLVQAVSRGFADEGIGVVSLNSLKYFWTARTPEQATADVLRIVRHYTRAWQADRLTFVGYSFGADVLPFVLTRLPADVRARTESLTVIAPSSQATFEVHVTGWLGVVHPGPSTVTELEKLRGLRILCVYGQDDGDAVCPSLPAGLARTVMLPGGHHFDRDFASVVRIVVPPR